MTAIKPGDEVVVNYGDEVSAAAAGIVWPEKPKPCLCGSASCQPADPINCSMKVCLNPGCESVYYSKKINCWVAKCILSEAHKSVYLAGAWRGEGCGRGLVQAGAANWKASSGSAMKSHFLRQSRQCRSSMPARVKKPRQCIQQGSLDVKRRRRDICRGHWTDTTQDWTFETHGALKYLRSYTALHVRNINKPWVDKI